MNYVVNVTSINNKFFGTGFMGEEVSSFDELKKIISECAKGKRENGKPYWLDDKIKLTFTLADTVKAFKENGDKQCKENGFVNMFSALKIIKKDPFYGYEIIFSPTIEWICEDGRTFHVILIDKKNNVHPFYGKLKELLTEIGIVL